MKSITAITIFILTGIFISTEANEAYRLVEEGNELYRQGLFSDALKKYNKALEEKPDEPEILLNIANCYYRMKNYDSALEFYTRAFEKSKDKEIQAKAKYNTANTLYRLAENIASNNINQAIGFLQRCMNEYRKSVKLKPDFNEAIENAELTGMLIKKLQEELLNTLKQQTNIENNINSILENQQNLTDEMENMLKGDTELSEEKKEELIKKQNEIRADTQKYADTVDNKDLQDILNKVTEDQKEVEENIAQNKLKEAIDKSKEAVETLKKSITTTEKKEDKQGNEGQDTLEQTENPPQASSAESQDFPYLLSEDPEKIIEEERKRRLEYENNKKMYYKPVDKDW